MRTTIDVYLVSYDKFDKDFNRIGQGMFQGFKTIEEAFSCASQLNDEAFKSNKRVMFKIEFKRFDKRHEKDVLKKASHERIKRMFSFEVV